MKSELNLIFTGVPITLSASFSHEIGSLKTSINVPVLVSSSINHSNFIKPSSSLL
tara:strand:- start:264 stop:428 length:165 start_codon:yes stop_codon:yes gene_type:complete